MSDKQMIEEMAKVLRQHICEDKPCDKCNYHGKTKILPRYCEAYIHSKTLYNAGYRKIPEGVVVLTREEYDEFLRQGAILDFLKDCHKEIRKETAEEFAERLKEELENRSAIDGYDLEDLEFDGEIIQECIDKICKEIVEG